MSESVHVRGHDLASAGAESPPPGRDGGPVGSGRRSIKPFTVDGYFGSWLWTIPALVFVGLVHYVATAAGGFYAFTDWTGLGDWNWVGLTNFENIVGQPALIRALVNTLIITFAFVTLTNLIGLGFALAVNRTLKTRYLLRVIIFAPVVLSPLAVSYIFRFIFAHEGPFNAFLEVVGLETWSRAWLGHPTWALVAIIVVIIWQHVGLTMVIYLAGLAGVPIEQEEAAALDGANAWQRLRYITLPSLRPAVAIASTLTLITGLRVFDQVMAMTGGGPFGATDTLATVVYRETFVFGQFGYGAALALGMFVLVLTAALFQLYLTRPRED